MATQSLRLSNHMTFIHMVRTPNVLRAIWFGNMKLCYCFFFEVIETAIVWTSNNTQFQKTEQTTTRGNAFHLYRIPIELVAA